MYSVLLFLPVTLFMCHFVHPCKVSEGIVCLSARASSFIHLSASFSLTSDCDITFTTKINHVLSVIGKFTILVKLFQAILDCY